jgi:hypothetical protein
MASYFNSVFWLWVLAVAALGLVLWLVTREAAISERAMELAGRAVQLGTAGIGAVVLTAMIWRAQPSKQPLTRWSILGKAAAAAGRRSGSPAANG